MNKISRQGLKCIEKEVIINVISIILTFIVVISFIFMVFDRSNKELMIEKAEEVLNSYDLEIDDLRNKNIDFELGDRFLNSKLYLVDANNTYNNKLLKFEFNKNELNAVISTYTFDIICDISNSAVGSKEAHYFIDYRIKELKKLLNSDFNSLYDYNRYEYRDKVPEFEDANNVELKDFKVIITDKNNSVVRSELYNLHNSKYDVDYREWHLYLNGEELLYIDKNGEHILVDNSLKSILSIYNEAYNLSKQINNN